MFWRVSSNISASYSKIDKYFRLPFHDIWRDSKKSSCTVFQNVLFLWSHILLYRVNFVGSISSNLYSSRSMSACSFWSFFFFCFLSAVDVFTTYQRDISPCVCFTSCGFDNLKGLNIRGSWQPFSNTFLFKSFIKHQYFKTTKSYYPRLYSSAANQ